MFDLDRWQEIFSSIRSNVLRTVLSGFTVALGLFIFIVLFGIGNGIQNTFNTAFAGDAANLIQIFTGKTSIAYQGLQADREVSLNNQSYRTVTETAPEKIEYSSPRYSTNMLVKYGRESGNYSVIGATPDDQQIEERNLIDGRYISERDVKEKHNVAVIGRLIQRDMVRRGNPIGQTLDMNGAMFKIIGVFSDEGGDREERVIVVPISTLQQMKKGSDTLSSILLTYNKDLKPAEAVAFGEDLEREIKAQHKVSPDDEQAVIVVNRAKENETTVQFMFVIAVVVGFIGLGTLIAGIIGISNIMVYIVKERTREIGVRKAIGAKPSSIVGLIIQESVVITVVSGLIGVGIGVLTLRLLGDSLVKYFITDPGVGWGLIAFAFFCLIFAGLIAGFVPAYKASRIKPIEALRNE